MRIFGNGKITEMVDSINENRPMGEPKRRVTKLVGFVNQEGNYADMSPEAEAATEDFINCFITAEGLSKVADVCEKRRQEIRKQSEMRMNELYHRNKGSLDDFLGY